MHVEGGNGHSILRVKRYLKYEKGKYPCGSCDFVGKTIDETINHCKEKHNYDLAELFDLNGIDPKKPEGQSVKIPGKFKHCNRTLFQWSGPTLLNCTSSIKNRISTCINAEFVLEFRNFKSA